MADRTHRRILFVSRSERLAGPLVHILRSAAHDVTLLPGAAEGRAWLRIQRADLVVVDLEPEAPADMAQWLAALQRTALTGPRLLVLVRGQGEAHLRSAVQSRLPNFLAVGEEELLDPVEFTVTVTKILTGDIFGMARYLAPGALEQVYPVTHSGQKAGLIDAVEAFAQHAGCPQRVAQGVAVAADELLTNAVYNAPLDAEGKARFAHLPRSTPVSLSPGEEVTLRVASDGRRLALAAVDPFGSLSSERVLDYLARCVAKGDNQVEQKQGGAGLGLYNLLQLTHHFILNLAPGQRTEVIGLIEVTRTYRAFAARAKSFNVFVEERR